MTRSSQRLVVTALALALTLAADCLLHGQRLKLVEPFSLGRFTA